ncbi:YbjO family protein [Tatumella sp. JGM118]|uniref:YbjO family protein n=1 Tax=Tatumella terrea TaxID=419007 RepID=A0ABW1W131_9GAMM|nr:YbjO family protein [Tatumella sp. JGM118]MBS0909697.1 DUF2593 family protein [Tatumella sp. JGM118]
MPGSKVFLPQAIPAPVLAAVISIIATRLFNLLMLVLLFRSDTGGTLSEILRLSLLPDYRLLFMLMGGVFLFEAGSVLMLLRGSYRWRTLFICCQCLVLLLILFRGRGEGLSCLPGIDPADSHHFVRHILLQKIPDLLIILLLCVPASSRAFFRRVPGPAAGHGEQER